MVARTPTARCCTLSAPRARSAKPPPNRRPCRQQLAAIHAHLPALATQIDTAHAEEAQQARREAVELSVKARDLRTTAEQLQAEQQLRQQISVQAPGRHMAEEAARDAVWAEISRAERTVEDQSVLPVTRHPSLVS